MLARLRRTLARRGAVLVLLGANALGQHQAAPARLVLPPDDLAADGGLDALELTLGPADVEVLHDAAHRHHLVLAVAGLAAVRGLDAERLAAERLVPERGDRDDAPVG